MRCGGHVLWLAAAALSTVAAAQEECSPPPPCDTVACAAARRAEGTRYRIPAAEPGAAVVEATQERMDWESALVFIHIFKAGGSTVKSVVSMAATLGGWYTSIAPSEMGWASYSAEPRETASMPRFIAGAYGMGHCELTERPCLYFTVLRDPFQRMVSEYDYFCVKGNEQRKEWNAEWKAQGACGASLVDWASRSYQRPRPDAGQRTWAGDGSNSSLPNHPNFLLDRLGGSDGVCALEDAKHNLAHPCLRYLLLPPSGKGRPAALNSTLEEQLTRLATELGGNANFTLRHAIEYEGHMTWRNVGTGKSARTKQQLETPGVRERLREILALDLELWDWAVEHNAEQWSVPLQFCHQRPEYTGPGTLANFDFWGEWLGVLLAGTPLHITQPYTDLLFSSLPWAVRAHLPFLAPFMPRTKA